ncbi:MAG: gliding motility-associated C-terminal domain-containing protein [Saprospiraceae bacterium]|nr:gliding motility-associated C-terminal domain-containing protein [Saprospiraceae bacterium]
MRIIWVVISVVLSWQAPFVSNEQGVQKQLEVCDNALDDDGDGLIDLLDPDCQCAIAETRSLIPNPSFEELRCCPQNQAELDCAGSWLQASEATTDFMHQCGWNGWSAFPVPQPIPDGEGFVGFRNGRVVQDVFYPNWKEYLGTCLTEPMEAGVNYRIRFEVGFTDTLNSPPIDIAFFGNTSCSALPFGVDNPDIGCPLQDTTAWIELGVIESEGKGNWSQEVLDIRSDQPIRAIVIGPSCDEFSYPFDTYYFLDDLVLDERSDFDFEVRALGHPCDPNFALEVTATPGAMYQWYRDGIAVPGAIQPKLSVQTGPGDYQVRVIQDGNCKLSGRYEHRLPELQGAMNRLICQGAVFDFLGTELQETGFYSGWTKNKEGCDSLVMLDLQVLDQLYGTMDVKLLPGESLEFADQVFSRKGTFEVLLSSKLGCDSLVELNISQQDFYVPNAFSPNGDGINDYFNIFGAEMPFSELRIFSRWGELVHHSSAEGATLDEMQWDGRWKGQTVPEGTYTYLLKVRSRYGQGVSYSGTILLIR